MIIKLDKIKIIEETRSLKTFKEKREELPSVTTKGGLKVLGYIKKGLGRNLKRRQLGQKPGQEGMKIAGDGLKFDSPERQKNK